VFSVYKQKMKNRRYSNYIKPLFVISDIICIFIAYVSSYFFRFNSILDLYTSVQEQVLFVFSIIFWVFLAKKYNAYQLIRISVKLNIITRTIKLILFHALLLFALLIILKYDQFSRLQLAYFYLNLFVLLLSSRILSVLLLEHMRASGVNYRTVAIVGMNTAGRAIYSYLQKDLSLGYKIIGYFDDNSHDDIQIPVLGKLEDVASYIREHNIDELYISSLEYDSQSIKQIIEECETRLTRIKIIPAFQKYTLNRRVNVDFYGNIPVIFLRKEPLENSINRFIKRVFDVLFSLLFFVCIAPWLFPILIVFVKISSRGSVFFVQQRSGENNKPFKCYKFRTMQVNETADVEQATKNDVRITKIGKCLRKLNLDELPQFYNVLRGDMSVVGPRPHMLKHTEQYSARIKNYLVRHFIKPGLTGWAQVNGYRGEIKTDEAMQNRVEHDIWYIENWSFGLDARIVIKTIVNVFKGDENAA
jgi:putative colanic acid biosynthesis UDP-glucose lipid carrier transferase